ncbi:MAG: hypothetical protein AAF810_25305 [Cyanobacteria bacterium P01_D01_bin.36]
MPETKTAVEKISPAIFTYLLFLYGKLRMRSPKNNLALLVFIAILERFGPLP